MVQVLKSMWKSCIDFLTPGFGLAQPWRFWAFEESINR